MEGGSLVSLRSLLLVKLLERFPWFSLGSLQIALFTLDLHASHHIPFEFLPLVERGGPIASCSVAGRILARSLCSFCLLGFYFFLAELPARLGLIQQLVSYTDLSLSDGLLQLLPPERVRPTLLSRVC